MAPAYCTDPYQPLPSSCSAKDAALKGIANLPKVQKLQAKRKRSKKAKAGGLPAKRPCVTAAAKPEKFQWEAEQGFLCRKSPGVKKLLEPPCAPEMQFTTPQFGKRAAPLKSSQKTADLVEHVFCTNKDKGIQKELAKVINVFGSNLHTIVIVEFFTGEALPDTLEGTLHFVGFDDLTKIMWGKDTFVCDNNGKIEGTTLQPTGGTIQEYIYSNITQPPPYARPASSFRLPIIHSFMGMV